MVFRATDGKSFYYQRRIRLLVCSLIVATTLVVTALMVYTEYLYHYYQGRWSRDYHELLIVGTFAGLVVIFIVWFRAWRRSRVWVKLFEDHLEVRGPSGLRSLSLEQIRRIERRRDCVSLFLHEGPQLQLILAPIRVEDFVDRIIESIDDADPIHPLIVVEDGVARDEPSAPA